MIKEVLVTWRDEPTREFYTLVEINENWITDYSEINDEGIFFYFTTEKEYQELLKTGTEEFTRREYA